MPSVERPFPESLRTTPAAALMGQARTVPAVRPKGARPMIWQLRETSHCSIVGTCLTLADLRRIARRTGFLPDEARFTDYEVHGRFVGAMNSDNSVSRAVQKHLDAVYEGALRKVRRLSDDDALLAYWEHAVEAGLVPAAYWALISSPDLSSEVEARVFGDVHMLSHICGASHRLEIRAAAQAQREKAELARRLGRVAEERAQEIARQRDEIGRLTRLVGQLQRFAEECGRLRQMLDADRAASRIAALEEVAAGLRRDNAALGVRLRRAELRAEAATVRAEAARTAAVPPMAPEAPALPEPAEAAVEDGEGPDLCGRCLLYVGGRPQTVCRLKDWVARRNGRLLHHDGGLEDSAATLGDLVRRADGVLFPVDCVSHDAVGLVKSLCEDLGIPFCPLRTASSTAFCRALRSFPRKLS